jgi:tetratricopeptide (TPR) repeat protein
MEKRKTRWSNWLALLMALAAMLPYLGTLRADFVWDDDLLVVDNATYRDPGLFWSSFTRNLIFSPNYYRPLGLLTFFADFQLYGFRPWGYHLTNVLLHAGASALAYLLLRRLLRGRSMWWPAALALLFAWHPVHVEAVSFVAGRFDLLSTALYLLALLLGLSAVEGLGVGAWEVKTRASRWGLAAGTGLAFVLAMTAKEMAATFPLVLAACYAWHATGNTKQATRNAYSLLRVTFPVSLSVTLAGVAYLALRIWGLGYLYLPQPDAGLPTGNLLQHTLLVGRSVARYLRLLIVPWGALSPVHYADLPPSTTDPIAWLALALTLGLVMLLVLALFRALRTTSESGPGQTSSLHARFSVLNPPASMVWLAFAVTLLPVVNLLPLEIGGGAFVCERFIYLPSFFFLAAVGAGRQAHQAPKVSAGRAPVGTFRVSAIAGVALACLAGVLTTVPHWRDDVALWSWAAERAPESDLPWVNLAVQAGNRGDAEEALDYANRALVRNPDNGSAHDAAGLALFLLEDYAGAERAFRNGLALEPDDAHLWSNLAGAVRAQGRLEEASHILIDEALARDPALWTAHLSLGLCHVAAGRPGRAVEPFRQAVRYQPAHPEPWQCLVGALAASGRGAEALEAMARSPFASPETWFELGNDLLAGGQAGEALRAYDRALAGDDPATVHMQRGIAFVQLGDLMRAEAALRAGLALAPDDGRLHNNLGMVLRDRGDLEGARAAFEAALRLLPDSEMVARNLEQLDEEIER